MSATLQNAWEVSENIFNLASEHSEIRKALDDNMLDFSPRNGWFCNGDILKPSVGLLCFKSAMSDCLSRLGLAIIQFKHEGNFRFSGTCISFGSIDSVTMTHHGDSDTTNAHTTAWLSMAYETLQNHLGS